VENFDRWMSAHQVAWRRKAISSSEWGWRNKKKREWILPRVLWEEGLWPSIRTDAQYPLTGYLGDKIKKHDGVHNLKSSWAQCANLYFPFGQSEHGRHLLAGFLQQFVSSKVESVDALELEYAEDGDLHPSVLLGELGGSRGSGQTSPDIGFLVNCGRGLILTENKLVEHSFYACSAHWGRRSSRPENPEPARCDNPLAGLNPETQCHQAAWGRKYWDHLAPVANVETLSGLRCCPATRSGYQLFRQQALAEGIARSRKYDFVVSSIPDIRDWGALFKGRAQFTVWEHQQWITWVEEHDTGGNWSNWLQYVKCRYKYR